MVRVHLSVSREPYEHWDTPNPKLEKVNEFFEYEGRRPINVILKSQNSQIDEYLHKNIEADWHIGVGVVVPLVEHLHNILYILYVDCTLESHPVRNFVDFGKGNGGVRVDSAEFEVSERSSFFILAEPAPNLAGGSHHPALSPVDLASEYYE